MELLKKLKIKQNEPLWVINAPGDCIDLFADLTLITKPGKLKPAGQLVLFATSSGELFHFLATLEDYIAPHTLFWVFYPKKSGTISSDLVLMEPWEQVLKIGYRGQSSASLNDNWTGLRMTIAPREKPSICELPMEERQVDGIDFVNRTVKLPTDAHDAVNQFEGMAACLESLSFTAKKEYVMNITGAKKEETRIKRINKMINDLEQKMYTSDLKTKTKKA